MSKSVLHKNHLLPEIALIFCVICISSCNEPTQSSRPEIAPRYEFPPPEITRSEISQQQWSLISSIRSEMLGMCASFEERVEEVFSAEFLGIVEILPISLRASELQLAWASERKINGRITGYLPHGDKSSLLDWNTWTKGQQVLDTPWLSLSLAHDISMTLLDIDLKYAQRGFDIMEKAKKYAYDAPRNGDAYTSSVELRGLLLEFSQTIRDYDREWGNVVKEIVDDPNNQ